MGVPMVQKQVKRRTSLVLGALLALLLGVAAGFLILALPIAILETLTTSIGLSSLMIQAEPPISPNDRTVLAVLAAILTSGIGWVLVDWLLFGRVGMTMLIKPREDEYEDDDNAFRPTDPLDLITPVDGVPLSEWNGAPVTGDARRPLSARTDIGDPPAPFTPSSLDPVLRLSPADQLLPPIDQILPGATPTLRVAPVAAAASPMTPDPFGSLAQPGIPPERANGWTSAQPPVEPAATPAAQRPGMPVWLPSPGVRQDAPSDVSDEQEEAVPPEVAAPLAEVPIMATATPSVTDFSLPPLIQPGPVSYNAPDDDAPDNVFDALPVAPPPFISTPFATPQPPEPLMPPSQPVPRADADPAPLAAAPVQAPQASAPFAGSAPLDRAMIDDLLTRLERGMRARRARAAGGALATPAAAAPQAAPAAPPPLAEPVATELPPPVYVPPAAPAYAPPPAVTVSEAPAWPPLIEPLVKRPPPAGFAMNEVPLAPPPVTPLFVPPGAQAAPAATADVSSAPVNGDQMIDQPLHTTLEQLRNMVRRRA